MSRTMAFVMAVLVTAITMVAPTAAVRADAIDGLAVSSASSYAVDPATGVVRAVTDLTFTNTTVDETLDGTVRRRYFTGFSFPVPAGISGQVATTSDSRPVAVRVTAIDGNDSFVLSSLDFPEPLFSGETVRLTVTYDITGRPPRSNDPSRVNPAYVAFTAYGIGDPGEASVTVIVPDGFEIDTFGSEASVTEQDGSTVYTADAIEDPGTFALFVTARNDDALVSTPLTTPDGAAFEIRGWPGDDEWRLFVADQITRGVPLLAGLIERRWPIDETVEIRQAVTPYLYGYAGWFSAADAELEIGEDLDAETVLHELSHAWFNTGWFADRWVNEGMAQVYSNSVIAQLGGATTEPVAPSPTDPGAIDLLDWGQPLLDTGADDTEAYGYNAAHWVMRSVVDEIGLEAMADVIAAVDDATIAYVGDTPPEAETRTTDWRRFLDLAEEIGGSTTIGPLVVEHVLRPADLALLPDRDRARARYAELTADGGSWAPPLAVRRAMATWAFDEAERQIDAAESVLAARSEMEVRATALGFPLGGGAEDAYESATDLADVAGDLAGTIDVADLVLEAGEAVAADPGLIERLGLMGDDPEAHVAEARRALAAGDEATARSEAQQALDTLAGAGDRGTTRALLGAGIAIVLLVAAAAIVAGRRRVRPPTPDPSR